MANGVVMIDRWALRLVGAADTTRYDKNGRTVHAGYAVREVGGELAHAKWADGKTWDAGLGSLRLSAATRDGKLAVGSIIALDSTDYRAVVDSNGLATIRDLLPGPYDVVAIDPKLAPLGIALPTTLAFDAARDSTTQLRATVPTARDYVLDACRSDGSPTGSTYLIGRVVGANGDPLPNAKWKVNALIGGTWTVVADNGITGASGLFHFCDHLSIGETIQIQVSVEGRAPEIILRRMTDEVSVFPIRFRAVTVAASGDTTRNMPAIAMRGVVKDSLSGSPIAGAYVSVLGSSRASVTDSVGNFNITGVQPGEYTVEVRTWALDSLGAVSQSAVSLEPNSGPVTLHVPTAGQIADAMCGAGLARVKAAGNRLEGVLLGTVGLLGDTLPRSNVSVIAEWIDAGDAAKKTHWIETRSDDKGSYRLCGVPIGAMLAVRAEGEGAGSNPVSVQILGDGRFARAELMLDPTIKRGAVFAGVVLADSTKVPVAGAEVAIPKLSKSATTNEHGTFHLSDIPAGTHDVYVRRVGFGAVMTPVTFTSNQTVERSIFMGRATALDSVVVTEASSKRLGMRTFEERKKMGSGQYVTRAEIEQRNTSKLSEVLRAKRGIVVQRNRITTQVRFSLHVNKPGLVCQPEIWIDGQRTSGGMEVDDIDALTVEGIELYESLASVPFEFTPRGSTPFCGSIVVWTKAPPPRKP
jgi:hypothetical protein